MAHARQVASSESGMRPSTMRSPRAGYLPENLTGGWGYGNKADALEV